MPTFPFVYPTYMNGSEQSKDQHAAKLLYFDLAYNTIVSRARNIAFNEARKTPLYANVGLAGEHS